MPPTIRGSAFSYVVIPDTQFYCSQDNGIFEDMTQWIADNQPTYEIEMVLHVGDIIQGWDTATAEWDIAESAISTLDDADIPALLAAGTHDAVDGDPRDLPTFRGRFPTSRYADMESNIGSISDHGTFDGNAENAYLKQEVAGLEMLYIAVEFAPRDAVMDWVVNVCESHPDAHVVFDTHLFLYHDGTRADADDDFAPDGYNLGVEANTGVEMWDGWLSKVDNLRMTHNGHQVGSMVAQSVSFGESENGTLQQFTNYQDLSNGGDGTLRLVSVNADTQYAKINTYSVVNDEWATGSEERFGAAFGRERRYRAVTKSGVRTVARSVAPNSM